MSPPRSGGRVGALLAWVGWWLALLGFWLALSNAATAADLGAGALAAAIGATASVLVRAQRRQLARPRPRWLGNPARPGATPPGPVATSPRDRVRLGRALVHPTPGRTVELPFAPGGEPSRPFLAVVAG